MDVSAAFSSRLQHLGIVQPNPTFSPSSTARPVEGRGSRTTGPVFAENSTVSALEARQKLEQAVVTDFEQMGTASYQGREFLDVATIRKVLILRDSGVEPTAIESKLRLKPGVVGKMGPPGAVTAVGGGADG
jgi:hypothetical protein